jgi:NAD(P)-dependent dehydrogenase (short-subunit alcohol dehydrogenase family)
VDLDATDPEPILRQKLIDELTSPDETLQVGLPGDRRLTVAPQVAALPDKILRQVDRDWVFLLTGGARGITAEIAKLLAARFQPTLILAGMSSLPAEEEPADTAGLTEPAPLKAALMTRMRAQGLAVKPAEVEAAYHRLLRTREIRRTLEDLRRTGARVAYHAVDVRQEAALEHLLDHVYRQHGRLDVVIHGAGVIEDKLIRDKTPESFDRVVHTKADSAFLLSRKLRRDTLHGLIFMSSITAALGNRGQADYAAANGIMNALATALDAQWPGRVVAMNWGPWDQAGMASGDVQQQFRARGIQLIPVASGAQALLGEIQYGSAGDPVVVLGDGPWTKVAAPADAPRVPARRKIMGISI